MALSIRLSRGGSKKRPYYRIVVADAPVPRDGSFIEKIGNYNPLLAKDETSASARHRPRQALAERRRAADRPRRPFPRRAGVA